MDLKAEVNAYIGARELIRPEDTLLIGVSGGADSLCLFDILTDGARAARTAVCHVHHHLRAAADEEELFVRRLCEERGVEYHRADVDLSTQKGLSVEEAARKLRYEAFAEILRGMQPDASKRCLAVAHTLDDDAETVLYHLFRGSGLKGLGGIRPCQQLEEYRIVRPLLDVPRTAVEEYLTARGMQWCEDESNRSDVYARNRIRHTVLPAAAGINERAAAHIHDTAVQLAEAEDYLAAGTAAALERITEEIPDGLRIDRKEFLSLHPCLQKRLSLLCLQRVSGREKDISQVHAELFCGLFRLPKGKMLDLPYRLHALRLKDSVELLRKS
ncbi:MAG: tRNA lysidine(34) synthetase TilS [Lachnospiraceae bacterium]|nr:tRNA lysidine(34) synthetase TilS [Lachnospiraceae bacterium]